VQPVVSEAAMAAAAAATAAAGDFAAAVTVEQAVGNAEGSAAVAAGPCPAGLCVGGLKVTQGFAGGDVDASNMNAAAAAVSAAAAAAAGDALFAGVCRLGPVQCPGVNGAAGVGGSGGVGRACVLRFITIARETGWSGE
jgi:hypothetical protein